MNLQEKAKLVNGETFFGTATLPQCDIEKLLFLDGGTGLNFEQLFGEFCSREEVLEKCEQSEFGSKKLQGVIANFYQPEKLNADEYELYKKIKDKLEKQAVGEAFAPGCFPAGILLGCTWNLETIYKVGNALGMEAAGYGVSLLLGTPNVNMMRDPLNGRLFESYGEDPYLMSKLAPQMVKGVQDMGVAANVKHFAANNQESFRVGVDEMISKRALHELYFPAFKACVEAKVETVMSAYNAINGSPCTENKWLLTDILREKWGFEGMVVSDWGAVYHPVEAIKAGNDLAMPGPIDATPLIEAVKDGTLSEEELDRATDRVLRFMERWNRKDKKIPFDSNFSDEAAYEAVIEGAVLLKNKNAIFPLQEGKVTLFGEGAKAFFDCGTGSAGITTNRTTSLYEELTYHLGKENVLYEAMDTDTRTVLIVVRQIGMEGNDRKSLELPATEKAMLLNTIQMAKQAGKKIGVILNVCGPVDCRDFIDDIDGMFCVFLPGMQGAKALADLLTGKENPSGKLNVTFPLQYEDTPTFLNFPGDGRHVIYGEDIFVGYRYYDKKKVPVLFPFGYGLSYTTFKISNPVLSSETFTDEVTLSVDVENIGDCFGKEVISLYVHDVNSTLRKPYKELKGFKKVALEPGEKKTVAFTVTKEMLASFDMDMDAWEAEEGYYDLIIATSVQQEICRKRVYGSWQSAYSYDFTRPIKQLYENEEIRPILFEIFDELKLDYGAIYDTYQYNSHTPFTDLLKGEGKTMIPASYVEKLKQITKP